MTDAQRVTAYYSGNVQGVGFRFAVAALAKDHPGVSGFVRNLSDGRVEIVAEGARKPLEALLSAVHAEMSGYISDCAANWEPATGDFQGFGIRR